MRLILQRHGVRFEALSLSMALSGSPSETINRYYRQRGDHLLSKPYYTLKLSARGRVAGEFSEADVVLCRAVRSVLGTLFLASASVRDLRPQPTCRAAISSLRWDLLLRIAQSGQIARQTGMPDAAGRVQGWFEGCGGFLTSRETGRGREFDGRSSGC